MDRKRDLWWHEAISGVDQICEPEIMDSEDPLFILYTSGSTVDLKVFFAILPEVILHMHPTLMK
ncbi:MAG: hypothetical protein CM15mP4_2980 [Candidatus Neomarinimicrobiota bacterium]|nr:MAG: hypothetical protein CM15mP4_2980 [Candidatus Neomarinimicrobiota bacterium]